LLCKPSIPAIGDPDRDPSVDEAQVLSALNMGPGCTVDPIAPGRGRREG